MRVLLDSGARTLLGQAVKSHLKSIHRKLDAPDRRAAARRARELEPLAP
jgi:DNA-binding NarL/FixJ family response regulator